jgi:hypothetical protein
VWTNGHGLRSELSLCDSAAKLTTISVSVSATRRSDQIPIADIAFDEDDAAGPKAPGSAHSPRR